MLACRYVASGPLVRSSYKAGEVFLEAFAKERAKEIAAARALGEGKGVAAEGGGGVAMAAAP